MKRLRTKTPDRAVRGHLLRLDLEPEDDNAKKMVYLLTASHPLRKHSSCGVLLRAPNTYSKADLLKALLDACEQPMYNNLGNAARASHVELSQCGIFQEYHSPNASGEIHIHYHVPMVAVEGFRWGPVKRALLQRHRIATHWSSNHVGYANALRYCAWPSEKKHASVLDGNPLLWSSAGPGHHPPLFEACQPPTTAALLQRRREVKVLQAAEKGEAEPRPSEIDVWPLVVKHNIRNTADNDEAYLKLIKVAKESCTPRMVSYLFSIRKKLPSLIEDVWTWETVSDRVLESQQTRLDALNAAMHKDCVCDGQWPAHVKKALDANKIDAAELAHDMYTSFDQGRGENTKVVTLAGLRGGEGKSFIFYPFSEVIGERYLQDTLPKGNFPLMDIMNKKIVLLDEWRFNSSVLPLAYQLLWFEGKPVPVARPQNHEQGNCMYRGSAPIFITTGLKRLDKMMEEAAATEQSGHSSEATMLLRRLKIYKFTKPLPPPASHVARCAHCFAWFLINGEAEWCQRDTGVAASS